MNTKLKTFVNGFLRENPLLVLNIGLCSSLGVTTSIFNGLGMGLGMTFVLVMSEIVISIFRKLIPSAIRLPVFITVIAAFTTIVQLVLNAYVEALYNALGVFIPLIVVNCIILGRAERYASKNAPVESIFDGLGMGFGFTIGLTLIGLIREILGAGTVFDIPVLLNIGFTPITIFIMAPGAFLVLAFLVAGMNIIRKKMEAKGTPLAEPAGCLAGDCAHCGAACPSAQKTATKEASEGGDK